MRRKKTVARKMRAKSSASSPRASSRWNPDQSLGSLSALFVRPTSAGVPVTDTTARNIAALFRAGTILSQTQASLPVEVIRDTEDGFELIRDHYVADLFNIDASDIDAAFLSRERIAWDAFWYGDGYAEIETRENGDLLYYHVLDTSYMNVEWGKSDGRWVRVYRYKEPGEPERVLSAKQVFHLPGLQFDGLNGAGIVDIARESIAHTLALDSYGAGMFGNSAVPAGILKTAANLDDETKDRLRSSWKKRTRENPNDIAILDGDFAFQQLGFTHEQAQFLESRAFQTLEVSRWTGVPPHMLGELSKANYNSLDMLGSEFKSLTLIPWMERWRGETRRKFFTLEEREGRYDVRYDYESLMRADRATRIATAAKAVSGGITTVNEERRAERLAPLPGGDELLTPLNMEPAGGEDRASNTKES